MFFLGSNCLTRVFIVGLFFTWFFQAFWTWGVYNRVFPHRLVRDPVTMEHHRIRVASETPEHHKKVIYETIPRCTGSIPALKTVPRFMYTIGATQNNTRGLPSATLLQLIRSMHPIQQPQRSIIQIELLMMKIMRSSLVTKEIISTVNRRRIDKLIS